MSESLPYTLVYRPPNENELSSITILDTDGENRLPHGDLRIGTVYTTREELNHALEFSAESHGCTFCSYVPGIGDGGETYFFKPIGGTLRCFFGSSYKQALSITRVAMALLDLVDPDDALFLLEEC